MKKLSFPVLMFIIGFSLYSCVNETKQELKDQPISQVSDSLKKMKVLSMPAPMQMASALFNIEAKYNEKLLVSLPSQATSGSNTNKAFRLGMYAVDIGYSTLFNKTSVANKYLIEGMKLAGELKVSGSLEKTASDRFKARETNIDSLTILILSVFGDVNQKLTDEGRPEVAFEILAGSFIEGTYLSSMLYKQDKNKSLTTLIGEQKLALNNVLVALNTYSLGKDADKIKEKFSLLNDVYSSVEVKTIEEKSEKSRLLVSEVVISDQQIEDICQKINDLRNEIIESN